MEVPDYLIRLWYCRYSRIAMYAKADPRDTRTLNALRLARKDLKQFSKYINQKMTRLERYKHKLEEFEAKRNRLMRSGKFPEAEALNEDIKVMEGLIREAEAYEESRKPRPIREIVSEEELHEMGIIPLMIECHLVADFLVEVSYMIVERCKAHGLADVSLMPDLMDIIKRTEKFASFIATLSPELRDLIVNNETFNASLHKKYQKYIDQRLK